MKARELANLGIPTGGPLRLAVRSCARAAQAGLSRDALRAAIKGVIENPAGYLSDPIFDRLAAELARAPGPAVFTGRETAAPWANWGEGLEAESIAQMERACRLPITAAGAPMPDAHVGYGLPIGGVLACENAIIPYAVGVDIACRMRLSVLDMPIQTLDTEHGLGRLTRAIQTQTRFGIGAAFQKPRDHHVLDADWSVSPITRAGKDKARNQLGTSGSGNHFVEFGVLTITPEQAAARAGVAPAPDSPDLHGSGWSFDPPPGTYLALLSHSGSRGTGATVCDHYSRIAIERHPELPKDLKHLAWLDMDSHEGAEYFAAMNLMGEYASANHECIHRHIAGQLGARAIAFVENHHNFAWKESHDLGDGRGPREFIVHRKGATPAGANVLGVIPGSMAAPGFVVRGRGNAPSLRSASHGAGRVMSRTKARATFAWGNVKRDLSSLNVRVLSAGIDEAPGVYKDIHKVMALQADLVDVVGRFDPRLVKMAPEGERAED
ncbi:MAG TPA: RtcB family protein [Phycisphaerales bacterium]|nr:RtcB family protein [Phycisphaerales bacterium]